MKIGLLQCDHVAASYLPIAGDYDQMFTNFLPGFDWVYYDVTNGQFPVSLDECDAYLCTGSKYSVYDDLPWIHQLKKLVQDLYTLKKPFIGICFGHQLMAEALGGKVGMAEVGWCVGVHTFRVLYREAWMEPFQPQFNLLMSCQDQVLGLPPESVVLAETADCPMGMYRVGEWMLGVQGHPEFSRAYARALMADRIERIGVEKVEDGMERLALEVDKRIVVLWFKEFLK